MAGFLLPEKLWAPTWQKEMGWALEAGRARALHLVINPVTSDHTLVTPVHQLEVGEESSAPGTDTTRGLSCRCGGEAYGCLLLAEI